MGCLQSLLGFETIEDTPAPRPSSRWAHLPANADDDDYSQMAEPVSPSGVDFSEDTGWESQVSDVADPYLRNNEYHIIINNEDD